MIAGEPGEVALERWDVQYVPELFALIDSGQYHLSPFDQNIAAEYPTIQSLWDSVVSPQNTELERYVIFSQTLGKTILGSVSAEPVSNDLSEYRIGYWLGAGYMGHGYATRAVKLLVDKLFERPGVQTISATTHPENLRGQGVLLRAGLVQIGDEKHEDVLFRIRRESSKDA